MAGKPRKPTFIDEPLQWHLSTTGHDYCPVCGADVANLGARKRSCLGRCGLTFTLRLSPKAWLDAKMSGLRPVIYHTDLSKSLPASPGEPRLSLAQAQKDSLDGMAKIPIRMASNFTEYAFWPKGAYEPHDDPEALKWSPKKKEVIRAGSPLWQVLVMASTWLPNKPKNILDKLIDDDDPSAKFLRRKSSAARRKSTVR